MKSRRQKLTRQPDPGDQSGPRGRHGGRAAGGGTVMSLNLTPMIDVVFLLLIYFLFATRWTTAEGIIPSRLPRKAGVTAASIVPMSPIRIRLTPAGVDGEGCAIAIENYAATPHDFEELYAVLVALRRDLGLPEGPEQADEQEPPLIIAADGDVRWDHVVNAFNAGIRAHWRDVQFGAE